jgi:hypothetical protein
MFAHAYNNIMAYFVPFPIRYLPNTRNYTLLVLHPLWLYNGDNFVCPGPNLGDFPKALRHQAEDVYDEERTGFSNFPVRDKQIAAILRLEKCDKILSWERGGRTDDGGEDFINDKGG